MLAKKFVPRALLQQNHQTSLLSDLGELILQLGYSLVNPSFTSTVANVSAERTHFANLFFYHRHKMKFKEQITADRLTTAIQEAFVRSDIYDIRGWGNKINYSPVYGTSYQWVDLPDLRIKYKWIDSQHYDFSSCLMIKPSSSQLTKLKNSNFCLYEINQSIKDVGRFNVMDPTLDENGWLVYPLSDLRCKTRLDFSSFDKMAVTLSNPHEFDGELKVNPNALPLMSDIVLTKLDHMLITARTGFGKTQLALALSAELGWLGNAILYFLDPKHSDLSSLGVFLGSDRYADTTEGINEKIHDLVKLMNDRYANMARKEKEEPDKYLGKNAQQYGYNNVVVFFDEISAHLAASKKCLEDLKQLLMKGRQAGIFLVLILQDPRATGNLPATIKDQTGIRIVLGKVNGTVASLVFGAGIILPDDSRDIGQGYIQIYGGDVKLFDAPLMPHESGELYNLMKNSLIGQKNLDPLKCY